MDLSIIVPHHSGRRTLEYCLYTLRATVTPDVEIIVVMNNENQDELRDDIVDSSRFRVLRFEQSLGYAGAINAGVAEARGRYLVLCDNDTSFVPGWLEPLVEFYRATPAVGTASAKLLAPSIGRIAGFGIGFTEYNAPHPFTGSTPSDPLTQKPRKVQAACSAVMMIEKALFLEAGRFTDRRHANYNDIDLCLRVRDCGRSSWVVPQSVAFHRGSTQAAETPFYKGGAMKGDQKAWFMARNTSRIECDMQHYFAESIDLFLTSHPPGGEYLLVDLATVLDRKWHRELIAERFAIRDVYEAASVGVRDAGALSLNDYLGTNLMCLRVPLLYFVDRFTALQKNVLWSTLRGSEWDVVVDRHANVRRFRDVVAPMV